MDLKSFYTGKTVFVTGHTGFKGSWLTKVLIQLGAKVIGYSLEPNTNPNLFELSKVESEIISIIGDVRDYDKLKSTIELYKPEIVFHLAAQPLVRQSYLNPVYTYETNVFGTLYLLEVCRQNDFIKSMVNVTTDKVYKNNETNEAYSEEQPLDGFDPYSNSKSVSELITATYKRSFPKSNLSISTVRAGNVIGGGDFSKDRIIPDCVKSVMNNQTMIVRNPDSIRPYQHVLEPIIGYLLVAMKQYDDQSYASEYNIGPDLEGCITTKDLVEMFFKHYGNRGTWKIQSDGGPHEAKYLRLDTTKFKKRFTWNPVWTIEEAVIKTVEWTKTYIENPNNVPIIMENQIKEYMESLK